MRASGLPRVSLASHGPHVITLRVDDGHGDLGSDTDRVTVAVVDTTAPRVQQPIRSHVMGQ